MENSTELNPLWVVILVGALSGVIGSVAGPIIQRIFARNDRALDARQRWAREKLQLVFGLGDEQRSSEEPADYFYRLVPPSGSTPHDYNMHTINPAVDESVDLMMLQPRRSKWARDWLYSWHFTLVEQARFLHQWMHLLRENDVWHDKEWADANLSYERRVRRIESSLSIWATGQWLTHSSLRIWFENRAVMIWLQGARTKRQQARMPESFHKYVPCDCVDQESLAELQRQMHEASFESDETDMPDS